MRHFLLALMVLAVACVMIGFGFGGHIYRWEVFVWLSVVLVQAFTIWLASGSRD